MRNRISPIAVFGAPVAMLALPVAAHAHHAMDNRTPGTLFEGLVSGLAHPVIGIDHLLFVLAAGAACWYFSQRAAAIVAFVAATLAGTGIHLYEATLSYPDAWVAVSLLVLGGLFVIRSTLLRTKAAVVLFALSGLVHGYAYGESIIGAEPTPLVAYLAGFALVQAAIAFGGYALARAVSRGARSERAIQAMGGVLSAAGVAFLALAFA